MTPIVCVMETNWSRGSGDVAERRPERRPGGERGHDAPSNVAYAPARGKKPKRKKKHRKKGREHPDVLAKERAAAEARAAGKEGGGDYERDAGNAAATLIGQQWRLRQSSGASGRIAGHFHVGAPVVHATALPVGASPVVVQTMPIGEAGLPVVHATMAVPMTVDV